MGRYAEFLPLLILVKQRYHCFGFFAKIVLGFCLASITFCNVFAAEKPNVDRVRLQLKWKHQFQFAGYYAAIAQGYYREAGLDVELIEAQPGQDPVEQVLAGRADFGVGTSELVILRAKGRDVVVLASIFQHSPLVLVARREDKISSLHDLVDRPVMIEPQSAEMFAYFRAEGVDHHRLKLKHHSFNVDDLIQGRVAAMTAYSSDELFQLQKAGLDHLVFTPRAGGIDFYGDNLFTTADQIQRFPERVEAFRKASLRGWAYAMAHSEEIVDLILKQYGGRKSREHLLFEAERTKQLMHPELIEVGYMNPGRWRHIVDTYADFGMVPRDFDLSGLIYETNPQRNARWVYWSLAAACALAIGTMGWALPLFQLNRKLRHEIAERQKTEIELREAKEQAEAADMAKGRYLAFMAHEVRTPLGGIVCLAEMIGHSPLSEEQERNLGLVKNSAESLLKLIGDMLDFSKLEADRMSVEMLPVSTRELVTEVCELFKAAAQTKGVALRHEASKDIPEILLTDPTRLRQVLSNLLSNAVKFTSRGSVEVLISVQPLAGTGKDLRRVRFQIKDTGMGISPEELPRLFKPYSQANATIARRHGGTGLGLSISKKIAQLLGGDIRVESTLGHGSTFTAEIVAEVPDARAA